jgi:hypothetical protein
MQIWQKHLRSVATAIVIIAFATIKADAQALPAATGPGTYFTIGGAVSLFQTDYGQRDIAGLTAIVDINPTWRYGIETEARYLRFRTSEQVTETNYFAGPRVNLPIGPWHPYAKFLVGSGRITLPFHYAQGSFLSYAPGGGIEYMPNRRLVFRVIDFEYQLWPSFPYGDLHPYGLTTGISIRLSPMSDLPDRHSRAVAR